VSATTPIGELIEALTEGLARPQHAWSAAVIVLALVSGWVLARLSSRALLRRHDARVATAAAADAQSGAPPVERPAARPTSAVQRLLFPLMALGGLWIGEGVLRLEHVINSVADARLLRLAMLLLGG
jgi:hypothetical protein